LPRDENYIYISVTFPVWPIILKDNTNLMISQAQFPV